MKEGTRYAARLKKSYARFRPAVATPVIPEPDDPLRRLGIAVLGASCGDTKAERAIEKVLDVMVDWNEVRISSANEVSRAMGSSFPNGLGRAKQLIDALLCIYHHENQLSLERLRKIGRREAREYLEKLDGVDEYVVASVFLWSLGGHAIPVDDRLLQALRDADLVHTSADRAEVQAFLERHVSASEAKEFCLVMQSFTADKGSRPKRAKTPASANRETKTKKH